MTFSTASDDFGTPLEARNSEGITASATESGPALTIPWLSDCLEPARHRYSGSPNHRILSDCQLGCDNTQRVHANPGQIQDRTRRVCGFLGWTGDLLRRARISRRTAWSCSKPLEPREFTQNWVKSPSATAPC